MKVRLLVVLTLLICSSAWAAPPQKHQYIVKLKYLFQQPNASAAAPLRDVVTRGGGQVDYEGWDRLVVTLPDNAVEAVAKHQSTKYMQLVRTGPPAAAAPVQTISTNSGNAGAPTTVARALSGPLRPVPTTSSTWDSGTYVYDGAGNITGIGTDSFTYDSLSRLKTASIAGSTETYTYDQFGNLIYKTTTPAQGPALPVDLTTSTATNQLSAQPYDTAGNLKGTAGTELNVYDPFNMLREKDVSGNGAEFYLYNANDERIAVISNPCGVTPPNCAGALITVSARDEDGHVLRQFDLPYQQFATVTPWLWLEDYVYRDGLLLAAERETAEGGRRHFHLDHLGSPRLVTGAGGARIAAHDYYPFGVEITPLRQETLAGFDREEPMKFTGHERDFNIGVLTENTNYNDYMHARSTVAQWGRFLSVDPSMDLKNAMTNPQMWNRYTYVVNNPIRFTDPDGREHVNEPGFTKPLSEADWSDAPAPVKASFYAIGAGLSLAADEFVIGPAAGAVFRGAAGLYEGYQASRALSAAQEAGVFVGKYGSDMAPKAVGFLAKMSGNGALKARVFEKMAAMISKLSPGWGASKAVAVDGSTVFTGTAGETLVINAKGEIFRGGLSAIKQTKQGVEIVWDALRKVVPK